MKIEYNEPAGTLEIKDDLKTQYFALYFIMVLNILNAVLRLFTLNQTGLGFQQLLWFIVDTVSLISLYLFLFKKSTSEKIKVEEIKRLRQKSAFGRDRYSLELVNGKRRDLMNFKSPNEMAELKKLLADLGKG